VDRDPSLEALSVHGRRIMFLVSFNLCRFLKRSRDNLAGIVTRLRAGWPEFDSLHRQEIFLLSIRFRQALGPHSVSYPMSTRACIPRNEAARVCSWQLTSISAEVKNGGAIPRLHLRLHGEVPNYIIKYREYFIFYICKSLKLLSRTCWKTNAVENPKKYWFSTVFNSMP
jgi:hypothetical protein